MSQTLQQQLRNARGQHYGKLYKAFYYSPEGQALFTDARHMQYQGDGLRYPDIGALMLKYDLPCTTTFKLLEDAHILPCGTWERCKERKLKATQVRKTGVIRIAAALIVNYCAFELGLGDGAAGVGLIGG